MSKHTPGPWWFAQHDEFGRYDVGNGDAPMFRTIAPADSGPGEWSITDYRHDHQEANARLVAAAPEILEALKGLVSAVEAEGDAERMTERARAAISKAEGK